MIPIHNRFNEILDQGNDIQRGESGLICGLANERVNCTTVSTLQGQRVQSFEMFFLSQLRRRRQKRSGLSRYRFVLFRQRLRPQSQLVSAVEHPYSILI